MYSVLLGLYFYNGSSQSHDTLKYAGYLLTQMFYVIKLILMFVRRWLVFQNSVTNNSNKVY